MKGLKILNKAAEAMSAKKEGHSPGKADPEKEHAAMQEHLREGEQSQEGILCPACHAKVQAHLASLAAKQGDFNGDNDA